jgi:ABC-type transporter Mla MlaB component
MTIRREQRSAARPAAAPPALPRRTVTLTVGAPLERAEVPGLLRRTCALLAEGGVELLLCDVAGVAADAVALEALARLALACRRAGCRTRLRGASPQLCGLVLLAGLDDVLLA